MQDCAPRQLLTVRKWTFGKHFLPDFVLKEPEIPRWRLRNNTQNQQRLCVNDRHLSTLPRIPPRIQVEKSPLFYAISAWSFQEDYNDRISD